jgi:4-alpha-glucanotransferase
MTDLGKLETLAELAGIEPGYWDIWGNRHTVSTAGKRSILGALGIPATNDKTVMDGIRALEEAPWRIPLPPAQIVREGERPRINIAVAAEDRDTNLTFQIIEEGGAYHAFVFVPREVPLVDSRVIDGRDMERRAFELPTTFPLGYHAVRVKELGDRILQLIVAPTTCYLPEEISGGAKTWGIATHLYTVRSKRNWGIGDFTDLSELVDVAAKLDAAVVGVNPLHALFPREPDRASPYSPSSRLFLNPVYLDVEAIPDFAECPEAKLAVEEMARDIEAARRPAFVDYPAVVKLKQDVLEILFQSFQRNHAAMGKEENPRKRDFMRFQEDGGDPLHRFSIFEALSEHFDGKPWQEWPKSFRQPDSRAVVKFAKENKDRLQFFQYLQWQADRQLAHAQARAKESGVSIGLYRDLAIGAAPDGAEAWSAQGVVVTEASVGAPPDPFNMLGQDWGTPPLHPHRMIDQAYEPFIAIVRANMHHAGALRIDHVMGLMHLFWIPGGELPASGAYLKYPFEDMLAIVALESHRNQCLVIGEDLGTVPEGFRDRMAAANVLSYKVLYFEKDGDRFKSPGEYPHLALSCISTHDLATLWGFWGDADIELKHRLKLYPSTDAERGERQARTHDRWLLLNALAAEGLLPEGVNVDDPDGTPMSPQLAAAIHGYVAKSSACLLMVQIDDLMEAMDQINLPGTVDERPNWRRRLPLTTDRLPHTPMVKALKKALTDRTASAVKSSSAA